MLRRVLDMGPMVDAVTMSLNEFDDLLEAELTAAMLVGAGTSLGKVFGLAVAEGLAPEFEARATPGALAMLLAIGAVAPGLGGKAASAAADGLIGLGVPLPRWAVQLDEPLWVTDCLRAYDTDGTGSMLACVFGRGGRSHAFVVSVDELDCGAAIDLTLFDPDELHEVLDSFQALGRAAGKAMVKETLDPGDFRWHVEKALAARAFHDGPDIDGVRPDSEGFPSYTTLASLLLARMAALPTPTRPAPPHGDGGDDGLDALQRLVRLVGDATSSGGAKAPRRVPGMPPKRSKADGPAPVYQLKVQLRGSKPPIWRRLEVPADISLDGLHDVLQIAFDWDGDHLHVFTTPHGFFGDPDPELDHQDASSVTLEQVAPSLRSKISYTYDFGDDWEHDIVVEKIHAPARASRAPRCTGGRRAAPPDDCGGMWGYAELVDVIGDPAHPEHEQWLGWLGLDDARDFVPATFDADAVTRRLARMP